MNAHVKLKEQPRVAEARLELLNGATRELGEMLTDYARSLTLAAKRGATYEARLHAVSARKVLIDLLEITREAQEVQGAANG